MLFVCEQETVPVMVEKKRKRKTPLTSSSLHGKGCMQYLGWLWCKVVQRECTDTSCIYFTKRVSFNNMEVLNCLITYFACIINMHDKHFEIFLV